MKYFVKSFFKHKNTLLYIGIFSLCFLFCFLLIDIYSRLMFTVHKTENKLENRELVLNDDRSLEKVKEVLGKIEHIIDIDYSFPFESAVVDDQLLIIEAKKETYVPQIVLGESLVGKNHVALISPYLEEKYHWLNKQLEIELENQVYSFTVVGVYESEEDSITIYIPFKDRIDLGETRAYSVIVDQYKNVDRVVEELKNNSFQATLKSVDGLNEAKMLINVCHLLIIVLMVTLIFLLIIIYLTIKSIVEEEYYDVALLKAIGYQNNNILKINLVRYLLLSLVSLLCALVGLSLIDIFVLPQIPYLESYSFLDIFLYEIYFIGIVIILVIIANVFSVNKIKRITPLKLFLEKS